MKCSLSAIIFFVLFCTDTLNHGDETMRECVPGRFFSFIVSVQTHEMHRFSAQMMKYRGAKHLYSVLKYCIKMK